MSHNEEAPRSRTAVEGAGDHAVEKEILTICLHVLKYT